MNAKEYFEIAWGNISEDYEGFTKKNMIEFATDFYLERLQSLLNDETPQEDVNLDYTREDGK